MDNISFQTAVKNTGDFSTDGITSGKMRRWAEDLKARNTEITYKYYGEAPKGAEGANFQTKAFDEDERSVVGVISTMAIDRDGDVLLPSGMEKDNFLKHPVVLSAHDYWAFPIGRAAWVDFDKKGIIAKTIYANNDADAEKVFNLRKQGIPIAQSVGFITKASKWRDDDDFDVVYEAWRQDYKKGYGKFPKGMPRRIITEWELIEYSDVSVPANPEALAKAAKSLGSDWPDFYEKTLDAARKSGIIALESAPDGPGDTGGEKQGVDMGSGDTSDPGASGEELRFVPVKTIDQVVYELSEQVKTLTSEVEKMKNPPKVIRIVKFEKPAITEKDVKEAVDKEFKGLDEKVKNIVVEAVRDGIKTAQGRII